MWGGANIFKQLRFSKLKAGKMKYFTISTLRLKLPTGQDMNIFFSFFLCILLKVNVALFFFFLFYKLPPSLP